MDHVLFQKQDLPHAYHQSIQICRAKVAARRGAPPAGARIMFGAKVPKNCEEAYALDKENGNTYWADAIKLELDALMAKQTLHFPKGEVEQEELRQDIKSNDYQYARIWWVFAVKPCGRRKVWL